MEEKKNLLNEDSRLNESRSSVVTILNKAIFKYIRLKTIFVTKKKPNLN